MSSFSLGGLRSRKINKAIVARSQRKRLTRFFDEKVGGALAKLGGGFLSVAKSVGGAIGKLFKFTAFAFSEVLKLFNLDLGSIWGATVETYIAIKEFNWNETDKALRKQMEKNNERILDTFGEFAGEVLPYGAAWLANMYIGRAIGGLKLMKVPVLSARIGLALAEEGAQELRASLYQFINQAGRALVNNMFIKGVLLARQYKLLGFKSIDEDLPNGSISATVSRWVEKLPNVIETPLRSGFQAAEDAIIDIGYIIAFEIDDYVAANKAVIQSPVERAIEVTLEEGKPPVRFIGPQDEVQQAITTTLATHELMESAELAVPETWSLKPGSDRPQLVITYRDTNKKTSGVLHIPHYNGPNPPNLPTYTTGPVQCKQLLKDGSTLIVYAVSATEGFKVLRAMTRYVPAHLKERQPVSLITNYKFKVRKVEPRKAEFWPKGVAGPPSWTAYLNVG